MRRLSTPSRNLLFSSMASARRASPLAAAWSSPPVSRLPHGRRSMAILNRSLRADHSPRRYIWDWHKNIDHPTEIVAVDDEEKEDKLRDEECKYNSILERSSHRDGSMYGTMAFYSWKSMFRVADRSETRLEAMAFSDPTPDCFFHRGQCSRHYPRDMLQILSLQVARLPADAGSVQLYGYVATRDGIDPFLNYVVNISRDDPIVVEQGSLITMTGPKRGIESFEYTLIEYDMRIKRGEQEKDDLQLLDGASFLSSQGGAAKEGRPFKLDTPGECGAIDITLLRFGSAAEATVEVHISEVQSSFSLSIGCFTSGVDQEIRLFDGAIAKSRGLKRHVVAVSSDSFIDLKLKVGTPSSSTDQHCCSFRQKRHGQDTQEIKTDIALISVKVTWSTLPSKFPGYGFSGSTLMSVSRAPSN